MNKRNEYLVYCALILMAFGASMLLVSDILEAKGERENLRLTEELGIDTSQDADDEAAPAETAISIFKDRKLLFANLVTRVPTPTRPILPPTATPIPPLCENWTILKIMGKTVQILKGDKKKYVHKQGETIPKTRPTDPPNKATHRLIYVDKKGDRVFLERISDGRMGWLYADGGTEFVDEMPDF